MLAEGVVPEAGDLAELEPDVLDGGFDVWTPFVEHLGRVLQANNPGALRLLEVVEQAVPLLVMLGEALAELLGEPLLHLIEDDLDGGIHGAGAFLEAGEVVLVGNGIQDSESDTRMLAIEGNWRGKEERG